MISKPICFDGYFAKSYINGVPRYAMEIIQRLDVLLDAEMFLVLPTSVKNLPNFKRIKPVFIGNGEILGGTFWELYSFKPYVRRVNGISINLTNRLEWTRGGITTVHDLIKMRKDKYTFGLSAVNRVKTSLKSFSECEWNRFQVRNKINSAKQVVTISEFSKSELVRRFGVDPNSIRVIGVGWEHLNSINETNDMYDQRIVPGEFFFYVGNILPHKNMKWILEVSKNNPTSLFVISGKKPASLNSLIDSELTNVIYTGYISDGYMKYLMMNCKALLMPSLIEGFGIPPLEKLAMGGQVIASNIPVFRESFGESIHYIDPYDYNVDLNEVLSHPVVACDKVLEEHSWEVAAVEWANLIKECCS